jgi:dTDP-4-amino-4,6-dideoxy-D-galactose acyltransferase
MDLFEKEKNKFELIYIHHFSDNGTPIKSRLPIGHFQDRKIIYSKLINGSAMLSKEINIYTEKNANDKLVELALQCGEFSRFKRDKNFKQKSYEHLYTKWIQNSTNRKLAFCVLVYGDIQAPDGFITIQKNGDEAHVGLFAVSNHSRNNGIGKKLMSAAEYFAQKHNFDTLSVTTQADNKQACRLYERCGFAVKSSVHTYHYWNKRNAHTFQ